MDQAGAGRFLSEDPLGLAGGINSVVFGADDPANNADATGLHPDDPQTLDELVVVAEQIIHQRHFDSRPWGMSSLPGGSDAGFPGSGQRSRSRPPGSHPDNRACGVAIGIAFVTAVGDVAAVTGIGIGFKLMASGIARSVAIGNLARGWMTALETRVAIATANKALANGATMASTAAAASVAGDFPVVWAADANGLGASPLDFIPVVATRRALAAMSRACNANR